jgi:ribonuclease HI
MYFDGSLKLDGGGAGVLFISPKGEQLKYVFQILFKVSNNEAEYEALLHNFRLAVSLGIKRLLVYGDSLLIVQQVNKEWDINQDTMDTYVEEIRKLKNKFSGLEIYHIDRENNVGADVLSKHGSTRAAVPPGVFVHELHHPSVKIQSQQATNTEAPATVREVLMIEEDWQIQFIDFIKEFKLQQHVDPNSAEAARIIR